MLQAKVTRLQEEKAKLQSVNGVLRSFIGDKPKKVHLIARMLNGVNSTANYGAISSGTIRQTTMATTSGRCRQTSSTA